MPPAANDRHGPVGAITPGELQAPGTDDGSVAIHGAEHSTRGAVFAAQGVIAGVYDIVIAAGVECMTRVPMTSSIEHGPGKPHGTKMRDRYKPAGVDPIVMLTAPIPATVRALEKARLHLGDIDVVEINEAFAAVVLAWDLEMHADMAKVPNGGAIALGHPLGCSGAKLMATMLNELERTGGRYGLQTMGENGGMANATTIERLG